MIGPRGSASSSDSSASSVGIGETSAGGASATGVGVAVGGPADGLTSTNIGVEETSSTPIGFSLQLGGTGSTYTDFTWQTESAETFGSINTNQTFSSEVVLFVNELHYDNVGSDVDEGIEVAGSAGLDLEGYKLILYNGNGGAVYGTVNLTGVLPDQDNGFGTKFFAINGLQNGAPLVAALLVLGDL